MLRLFREFTPTKTKVDNPALPRRKENSSFPPSPKKNLSAKQSPPIGRWAIKELFPIRKGKKGLKAFLQNKIRPCSSTFFTMLSIGVLLMAGLVIGGVLYGTLGALNQWISSDPLFTRIVADSAFGAKYTGTIKEDVLKELRDLHYSQGYYEIPENSLRDLKNLEEKIVRDIPSFSGKKFYSREELIQNLPDSVTSSTFQKQILAKIQHQDGILVITKEHKENSNLVAFPLEVGVFPFMDIDYKFPQKDVHLSGRTVQINDPILNLLQKRYLVKQHQDLLQDSQEGFIVSSELLQELELPFDSKKLNIDYHGIAYEVPILWTVSWLPDSARFLTTEGFWTAYRDNRLKIQEAYQIRAGPFPVNQTEFGASKKKLDSWFKNKELGNYWEKDKDRQWLVVEPPPEDYNKSYWDNIFPAVLDRQLDSDAALSWDYQVDIVDLSQGITKYTTLDPTYFTVSLYVRNLDEIRPTIDFVKNEIGLRPDETIAGNLDFIDSIEVFGLSILFFIFIALTVITGINVYLTFSQRVRLKQKEIGIMRAYGLSKSLLKKIYSFQAFLIWLGALGIGLFLGIPLGFSVGWVIKAWFLPEEIQDLLIPQDSYFQSVQQLLLSWEFYDAIEWLRSLEMFFRSSPFTVFGKMFLFPGDLITALFLFTLLLCLISTRLGISSILKLSPAEAVRL